MPNLTTSAVIDSFMASTTAAQARSAIGVGNHHLCTVENLDSGWPNFTGGWTAAYNNGEWQKAAFTTVVTDPSSAWNATNNEYTCPEAGTYLTTFVPLMVSDMSNSRRGVFGLTKNGTTLFEQGVNAMQDDNTRNRGAPVTIVTTCAAGDILSLGVAVYNSSTRYSLRATFAKL